MTINHTDMSNNEVLAVVEGIIAQKRNTNKRPLHALSIEIHLQCGQVDAQLKALVEQKILTKGRTINYDYYKPCD